mgnify:CR=1 FL=1
MYVPTLPQGPVIDPETGYWTTEYKNFWDVLLQNMQQALSNEGFLIPSQPQSQLAILQLNAIIGTLIFDTSEVNGGSMGSPNGQLYVKLADGIFHKIVNT